jgi:DNA-binding Xre family transcriptional regulator
VYYTERAIVRRMIVFRLDHLLKKRGWTAYRLAQESGIHPSVLSKYVNNQVKEISLDTLDALCRSLACRAGESNRVRGRE